MRVIFYRGWGEGDPVTRLDQFGILIENTKERGCVMKKFFLSILPIAVAFLASSIAGAFTSEETAVKKAAEKNWVAGANTNPGVAFVADDDSKIDQHRRGRRGGSRHG